MYRTRDVENNINNVRLGAQVSGEKLNSRLRFPQTPCDESDRSPCSSKRRKSWGGRTGQHCVHCRPSSCVLCLVFILVFSHRAFPHNVRV